LITKPAAIVQADMPFNANGGAETISIMHGFEDKNNSSPP